jgi:hypothetical protein
LVPTLHFAQGERIHCRRFSALLSQGEGAGALFGHGGVQKCDGVFLVQTDPCYSVVDASPRSFVAPGALSALEDIEDFNYFFWVFILCLLSFWVL